MISVWFTKAASFESHIILGAIKKLHHPNKNDRGEESVRPKMTEDNDNGRKEK